jgi:hypothetical protein
MTIVLAIKMTVRDADKRLEIISGKGCGLAQLLSPEDDCFKKCPLISPEY